MQLLGGLPLGMTAVILTLSQPLTEQKAKLSRSLWAFTLMNNRLQGNRERDVPGVLIRVQAEDYKVKVTLCYRLVFLCRTDFSTNSTDCILIARNFSVDGFVCGSETASDKLFVLFCTESIP